MRRIDPNLIDDNYFRDIVDINYISPQVALVKLLNNLTRKDELTSTFYDGEVVEKLQPIDFKNPPINTKFKTDKEINQIVNTSEKPVGVYKVRVYSLNTLVPDTKDPLISGKFNDNYKKIFNNSLYTAFDYSSNDLSIGTQVKVYFIDNHNFNDCYISEVVTAAQQNRTSQAVAATTLAGAAIGTFVGNQSNSRAAIRTQTARISSLYGEQDSVHPNGHGGIDIAVPEGTQVYSGNIIGTVVDARLSETFGNVVVIRYISSEGIPYNVYYAHLSQINVRKGQTISEETIIGKSGNTGRSTGPHLHIEFRQVAPNGQELKEDGRFVRADPISYIQAIG